MAPASGSKQRTPRRLLRSRSKKLFGNADRLEVAAAVARASSGVVNGQDLSDELRISPPRVRSQLLAFCDAGVMRPIPRTELRQYYERIDSPFWTLVSDVVDAWS